MIDTLMVLWTKGICTRFLRVSLTALLPLAALSLLLFILTANHIQWPGLAFTASVPAAPAAVAKTSQAPANVSQASPSEPSIPFILKNPTPALESVSLHKTSTGSHPVYITHKQKRAAEAQVTPTVPPSYFYQPTQSPFQQPSDGDWFTNAVIANGKLAGELNGQALRSLLLPALLLAMLMTGCCLLFLSFFQRKGKKLGQDTPGNH
jgi:hypothetical protein